MLPMLHDSDGCLQFCVLLFPIVSRLGQYHIAFYLFLTVIWAIICSDDKSMCRKSTWFEGIKHVFVLAMLERQVERCGS
jgi:hypothetical protein